MNAHAIAIDGNFLTLLLAFFVGVGAGWWARYEAVRDRKRRSDDDGDERF